MYIQIERITHSRPTNATLYVHIYLYISKTRND
jgi:hypothetical protein